MEAVNTMKPSLLARIYQTFCRPYVNGLLAEEISSFSRYYDSLVQLTPRADDGGELLRAIDCPKKSLANSIKEVPGLATDDDSRQIFLLNGNLNHHFDIEGLFQELRPKMNRHSRLGVVVYNSYLRGLYQWANRLGMRKGELPSTFFTQRDLDNLAHLAGFQIVRARPVGYFPLHLFGIGNWLNRFFQTIPVIRWLAYAEIALLKPNISSSNKPSLSIVIPARNEKGNIENALKRLPDFGGAEIEIIFVEGHSSDQTWEEILRVKEAYGQKIKIQAHRQTGKGKADAVRLGFAHAKCELLTILDADLTMPPELLTRFYDAYAKGLADFVNGSRLVYPMEGEAMRFLNLLGNIFFAKALSFVLECPLGDSLCGTKLVSKRDYDRFIHWRKDFGEFDPFGDFELLFPAAILGLGVVDIPIRYRARTYGSTNIHRFRHGFILLQMTLIGLFRIRFGKGASAP